MRAWLAQRAWSRFSVIDLALFILIADRKGVLTAIMFSALLNLLFYIGGKKHDKVS